MTADVDGRGRVDIEYLEGDARAYVALIHLSEQNANASVTLALTKDGAHLLAKACQHLADHLTT